VFACSPTRFLPVVFKYVQQSALWLQQQLLPSHEAVKGGFTSEKPQFLNIPNTFLLHTNYRTSPNSRAQPRPRTTVATFLMPSQRVLTPGARSLFLSSLPPFELGNLADDGIGRGHCLVNN
jgi:hypothetical protein